MFAFHCNVSVPFLFHITEITHCHFIQTYHIQIWRIMNNYSIIITRDVVCSMNTLSTYKHSHIQQADTPKWDPVHQSSQLVPALPLHSPSGWLRYWYKFWYIASSLGYWYKQMLNSQMAKCTCSCSWVSINAMMIDILHSVIDGRILTIHMYRATGNVYTKATSWLPCAAVIRT